ncbi:glycosyltransferase [Pontibacillus marinus BH030004 = DSM 16465]|uniref:Glycosyltransferase n=1 Tax=Pontibacillus marinus BH030004 = DSM 16465 TaxID=1385511 RepID=A0A0A5G0M4_9BACI|nr:glycosyltransferase family 2 protein [Pontibacillus marinus]KGX86656.1 glycosyltransferase [Pontibacillus marinus BH030004 = DSM 16465]
MVSPYVSIVIPTYNRLLYLTELMECLSRQTFQSFEIIIVNDCGEKVDIVKELYPQLLITIIEMDTNVKHVHARNVGVAHANGDYIMLIDDDDLIVSTHLKTMLEVISEYDLIYSDVEIVNYEWIHQVRVPKARFLFAYELDLKGMRTFSTFIPSGCLYRKEIHDQIGGFDADMHHYWDWDFFLRVSEKFRVNRVPVAGVLYDFSDSHGNQSKNVDSMQGYLKKLSEKHNLGELPTKNFFTLLDEPGVKKRKAGTKQVWDGTPFRTRATNRTHL